MSGGSEKNTVVLSSNLALWAHLVSYHLRHCPSTSSEHSQKNRSVGRKVLQLVQNYQGHCDCSQKHEIASDLEFAHWKAA